MKIILVGLLILGNLSVFAKDLCIVKTQGRANPLISCSSKTVVAKESKEEESIYNLVKTLKILLDDKFIIKSVTSISDSQNALYVLIKE